MDRRDFTIGLAAIAAAPTATLAQSDRFAQGVSIAPVSITLMDGTSQRTWPSAGRVGVLLYWASWCPFCRRSMPDFAQLHQRYAQHGLQIVGVCTDPVGTPASVRMARQVPFDSMWMQQLHAPQLPSVSRVPTMHIANRQGQLAFTGTGYLGLERLEALVRPLLGLA